MKVLSKDSIRILNFDNSLLTQNRLLSKYAPKIVDLKEYGSKIRYWGSVKDLKKISSLLLLEDRSVITFTGSGDYHHVSFSLISKFGEPISVVIFDNHPDWDMLGPRACCGCWVNLLVKMPNVLKIVHFGTASCDLLTKNIQTANVKTLENDRVELYPFFKGSSRVFLKHIKNTKTKVKSNPFFTTITWKSLEADTLSDIAMDVIKRLPTKEIYISIDKDCLKREYALTNWESGQIALGELLKTLRIFKERTCIAGFDINGEYSKEPKVSGFIKERLSALDHPQLEDYPSKETINSINEDTNLAILNTLFS